MQLVSDIEKFIEAIGEFLREHGTEPTLTSQAITESTAFRRAESVKVAYSQGNVMVEVAADHMMAFIKSLTVPAQTIAPWTCVRSVLESSALAIWFLDPTLDVRTRVGRGFAFRYEGLEQQVKWGRAAGRPQSELDKVESRIDEIEQLALSLGYATVVTGNGKRNGISQVMPSITKIIGDMLDNESDYRLLSAMAHCHPWAVHQLGFRVMRDDKTEAMLEKHIEPASIGFMCVLAITAFTKALWHMCQYFGWQTDRLKTMLNENYDKFGIVTDLRCWHHGLVKGNF